MRMRHWKRFRISPWLWGLAAIALAYAAGKAYPAPPIDSAIPVALFLMLFPAMLEVDLAGIRAVLFAPVLLVGSLVLNFFVSPLLMFGILHAIPIQNETYLTVGMTLYSAVPCGGLVPVYTGMLNGNVGLAVTITAASLLLSLGIVPLWITALIGTMVPVPPMLIFTYLAGIIIIPLTLALVTRSIVVRRRGVQAFSVLKERMKVLSSCGLILFLFVMSLLHGDRVVNQPALVLRIALVVSIFMGVLVALSGVLGSAFNWRSEDVVALKISTAAKNNAVALALAYSAFGADAALVNAISGPLVQLPILLGFIAVWRSFRG